MEDVQKEKTEQMLLGVPGRVGLFLGLPSRDIQYWSPGRNFRETRTERHWRSVTMPDWIGHMAKGVLLATRMVLPKSAGWYIKNTAAYPILVVSLSGKLETAGKLSPKQ